METYKKEQQSNQPYRLNSFKLAGLESVALGYRLVDVNGLIEDEDDYEKKINQLAVLISGSIKMPSEPIRINGATKIAVIGPSDKLIDLTIDDRFSLTPDDVFTSLDPDIHRLSLNNAADRTQTRLIRRALDWALDSALKTPTVGWWKYDRRFVSREPLAKFANSDIQVFPAFFFGFVPGKDAGFELSINPSVCYAERKSLYQKHGDKIPPSIKGRRFLYKNGLDYYPITVVGIGKRAGAEMMEHPKTGEIISIQDRLRGRWKQQRLIEIESLDENALTVAYKTRGQKSRRAHSQLVFELVGTGSDSGHHTPHNEAIMAAAKRGSRTEELIGVLADHLKLFGFALKPDREMRKLNGEVRLFEAPRLQFADGTEVSTNFSTLERDRWDALKHIGPLDRTDFGDEQLFIFGEEDLPEEVRNDFKRRIIDEITEIYGKSPRFHNVKVDNKRSRVVREHFNAITGAVHNRRGYGLLVLPAENRPGDSRKLHDAIKRRLWSEVHTQCVAAERVLSFYILTKDRHGERRWQVRRERKGKYGSYLKNVALAFLEVNNKWLWKLAPGTLRNDVHIGIDVYQDLAVFTFIYGNGDLITFETVTSKRGEKLSVSLVYETIVKNLTADLPSMSYVPKNLVFHRDGKFFRTEARGILTALDTLKEKGLIAHDFRYGLLEIHKTSAARPRLYKRSNGKFENPDIGLFAQLSETEGVLATTGAPVTSRGTAQPLTLERFMGNISLEDLAHDAYALTHFAFSAPGAVMSLPFTIALADRVLKERSPGVNTNLWDDAEEGEEIEAFVLAREVRVGGNS